MKIRELYNACGNITRDTIFRVHGTKPIKKGCMFVGSYFEMELEMKEQHVVVFEFDNDMKGILVVVS